ncbi:hypothetical protein MCOR25_008503 [Pyricularia grisea]|nr:hypothetical protein MCOR25_008503 [Pyricularia grisea]
MTAATPVADGGKKSWLSTKHLLAIHNFKRILTYGTQWDKIVLGVSTVSSVATGLTIPLMVVVFARLIGIFTDFYRQGSTLTGNQFSKEVNECVYQIIYLFVARIIFSYISNLGFRMFSLRISSTIRTVYLRSLFSLPISVIDAIPAGQTAAIVTVTAGLLQVGISEKLGGGIASLASVASSVVVALVFNWLLTLVTIAGLAFIAIVYVIFTPLVGKKALEVHEADVKASSVATEAFTSVRMLAACGAENKVARRYAVHVDESYKKGLRMAWLVGVQQMFVFFGVYATFALAFYFAFRMYNTTVTTTPEDLIVVLLCVMMMATSIGQITAPLAAAQQAAEACGIFHTIIDFPKPVYGSARGEHEVRADGDIVLMNVNFAYPTRPDVKVLDNLSLVFPAGKVTAIVGPSGSGKSTIVGILERWYEFNGDPVTNPLVLYLRNGFVSVGGRLLTEIDVKWWRNQIGLVQQDNVLFNTTIYKNVEHGLIGTIWEHESDEKKAMLIETACRDAFADEFINRLPDRYQTTVGESGIKLSGGQRQRLAIARAIVKQPKILILDEATSAIDVRSEQIVQAALERASRGRTTVVIAHRLGTVKKADKIIVLSKGQVVQEGTHDELRRQRGSAYYLLANAQSLNVRRRSNRMSVNQTPDEEDDSGYFRTNSLLDGDSDHTTRSSDYGSDEDDDITIERPRARARDDVGEEMSTSTIHAATPASQFPADDAAKVQVVEIQDHWLGGFAELLAEQGSRWKLYFVIIIGAVGAGASTPVQAYLFATLLNLFSFRGAQVNQLANFFCLMFVVLAAGVGISHLFLGWSTTRLGFGLTRFYRKEYFKNMISRPASFFDEEDHTVGSLTARLATDPTQLQQLLGVNMAFVLVSIFNVIGCCIVGFVFGWKLTIVSLASTMPIIVVAMAYRVRHEVRLEAEASKVFAEGARFASESIAAIRTVSSLTMEDGVGTRYEELLNKHVRQAFGKAKWSLLLFSFSDSISFLCMAFVLWYGGRLLASREYSPFQYVIVYIAVVQGAMSAGQWLSFGPNIAHATAAADRVLDMREPDDELDRGLPLIDPNEDDLLEEKEGAEVELRDVWFSYPTRPGTILKGLDIKVERGQFAAIVGPSGSGKTTVISLLERFYGADSGQVLYNGHDVLDLEPSAYRSNVSLVAQEPHLLSGSMRDNILLGIEDESTVVQADIYAACQEAGLHDFISSLPEGYSTEVGARGIALSGGQKQRLSIARALIRRPTLLLLDEATSALDSETERAVQETFEATKGSRTMIVVAHRLATVKNADVIFVMADGKVIEQGNHVSLLESRGVYYEMLDIPSPAVTDEADSHDESSPDTDHHSQHSSAGEEPCPHTPNFTEPIPLQTQTDMGIVHLPEPNGLKILVAPAAYKGCLQPDTAADCISAGILSVVPDARIRKLPLIDGGEGFTRGIVTATGGSIHQVMVSGPLNEPVQAFFGMIGHSDLHTNPIERERTAIIEMSAAAGLSLVPADLRNPCVTTTYGVGKLVLAAMESGAQRIIIGCGDSATCDGGTGMLQALGAVLLDENGRSLPIAKGGESILRLHRVDIANLDARIANGSVQIEAAVNWKNVLTGPKGQARIYSEQKGATPDQIELLSSAMDALAFAAAGSLHSTPEIVGKIPGSGASGGMGTALLLMGGRLRARCDVMDEFLPPLDTLFDDTTDSFDLVITAEGGLDYQTPRGKMPAEVARRASSRNIPVVAIAGTIGTGAADNLSVGIKAYACMLQGPSTLAEAMVPARARQLLEESAASVMRTVLVGMQMAETKSARESIQNKHLMDVTGLGVVRYL